MDLDLTFTELPDGKLLSFLKTWMDFARTAIPKPEIFGQDIDLIQGRGRYMQLLHHRKLRIRKKNNTRARSKKGLPGIKVILFKNCYPIAVGDSYATP